MSRAPVSLRILPDSTGLAPGETFAFTAEVKDASGASVAAAVHWSVADSSIASIDSTGHARGRASGRTEVEARTTTLRDVASLHVESGATPTLRIEVVPPAATYIAGDRQPFLADVHDGDGHFVASRVAWSVSDTSVASVDSTGDVRCKRAGTSHVVAEAGGGRSEAVLSVLAAPTVSAVAGGSILGFQDGAAADALFALPFGLAEDSLGAVYVADLGNYRIRVLENGQVRTLAGNADFGFADGAGAAASFNLPTAVAVGPGRRVYVADQGNNLIRRVDPDGTVMTLAGMAGGGYRDGAASQALFDHPSGIAVDAEGNVFIADKLNHVVRVLTAGGEVRTLCGSAGSQGHEDGAPGLMDEPSALVLGPGHTLLVCERGGSGNTVRKLTYDLGVPGLQPITTVSGNGAAGVANGLGQRAQFNQPYGIARGPDGWVYVSDSGNHRIRAISPAGQAFNVAGTGGGGSQDGPGETSTWSYPAGMVYSGGDLLVLDAVGQRLRRIHGLLHVDAPAWTERTRRLMEHSQKRQGQVRPARRIAQGVDVTLTPQATRGRR